MRASACATHRYKGVHCCATHSRPVMAQMLWVPLLQERSMGMVYGHEDFYRWRNHTPLAQQGDKSQLCGHNRNRPVLPGHNRDYVIWWVYEFL